MSRLFITLLLSTVALGCLDDLPPAHHVDKLRVLAIVSEPPEVEAGGTVALSALVVDPHLEDGETITYKWRACVLPERLAGFAGSQGNGASGGSGYSVQDPGTCFDVPDGDKGVEDLGTEQTASFTVKDDFLDDTDAILALYGIPPNPAADFILKQLLLPVAGVNITIALEVRAGDQVLRAFKRVNVSTADPKNANPTDVLFHMAREDAGATPPEESKPVPEDGECFFAQDNIGPIEADTTYVLTAMNIPEPAELYPVLVGGPAESGDPCTPAFPGCQMHEEALFYSFFSTQAGFGDNIIKSKGKHKVTWETGAGPLPDPLDVWIVTRDGRGGASWCHSQLDVKN